MPNTIGGEFETGGFRMELLPADEAEGWQIGSIDPRVQSDSDMEQLGRSVIGSLVAVRPEDMDKSECTDGRLRLGLADGNTAVSVKEKLVGADSVTAFIMAESLGTRFYGNDKATTAERTDMVVSFLAENHITACTHEGCGAAGSLVPVVQNIVAFSPNLQFIARQKRFVPVYDPKLYSDMVYGLSSRINSGTLEDYSDALLTAAVIKHGGDAAVARYQDDGRGVKGHREGAIVRIIGSPGYAVDVNQLAEAPDNPQVFSVNDSRIARLAALFGGGNDEAYATAYMAAEAFTDAGHGTLGKNLRTIILQAA